MAYAMVLNFVILTSFDPALSGNWRMLWMRGVHKIMRLEGYITGIKKVMSSFIRIMNWFGLCKH